MASILRVFCDSCRETIEENPRGHRGAVTGSIVLEMCDLYLRADICAHCERAVFDEMIERFNLQTHRQLAEADRAPQPGRRAGAAYGQVRAAMPMNYENAAAVIDAVPAHDPH